MNQEIMRVTSYTPIIFRTLINKYKMKDVDIDIVEELNLENNLIKLK